MPLQREKALLIVNPRAGIQGAKKNFYTIVENLSKKYTLTVHITESARDARKTAAAAAEEFGTLFVCGGDGTLSQVIDGYPLEKRCPQIGYIPCGTANDFASTLNLPKNIKASVKNVCEGEAKEHDVGSFNLTKFIYVASFGAFTKASYSTPQDAKNVLGQFAYFLSGVFELASIKPEYVKVICDEKTIETDKACFFSVSNSTVMGGGTVKIPPDMIGLNDGKMELLIINLPATPVRLAEMIAKLGASDFNDPDIYFLSGTHFDIETHKPVEWTLDGEEAGSHSRVTIDVLNNAVKFIRK